MNAIQTIELQYTTVSRWSTCCDLLSSKRVTLQLKVETFTLTWTTRKALLYTRFGEMITCILLVKRLHVICFASASGEMFGIRT